MPPRILISTSTFGRSGGRPLELLEEAGVEVRLNPYGRKLRLEETVALLEGVDAVVAGSESLDRQILRQAPGLRLISRFGAGLDNVDLEAAAELGIAVRSTHDAHVDGVAELTLAGILDLLRMVARADRDLRRGEWSRPMGRLLRGRRVGIVGLGRVGKRLVRLLEPFKVEVLAHDLAPGRRLRARAPGALPAPGRASGGG